MCFNAYSRHEIGTITQFEQKRLIAIYRTLDELMKVTSDSFISREMSRVMRKPTFCICENKDADQLRGYDQRLCFRYIDSAIPLLSKSEISNL